VSIQRIERLAVIFIVLIAFTAMPALAQVKVGYVDTQYILAKYQRSIDVANQLQSEYDAIQKELDGMQQELISGQQKLEQQSLMLSEEKKREQVAALQSLYQQIQTKAQEKEAEHNNRREELLAPVFEEVDTAIKKVGNDKGFDFIMRSESLLFAKDALNVTEAVLEELKKVAGKTEGK
jgi:outer membrane protein